MIDMRRLQMLREVAVHGSFSKAAAALLLTPSAVSQQIAALERSLGAAVVTRGPRGIELTESGRLLAETADVIVAELAHAQEQIGRLAKRTRTLTVATFTTGGQRLLPSALQRLHANHPGVEMTVVEREPEQSLALVRQGQADLALTFHFGEPLVRPGERSGVEWTPIQDDPLWIVLPADHPLAHRPRLALEALATERWVQGCVQIGALLDRYAAAAGFEFRYACHTTDYIFAQSLVAAGVGITVIPQIALVKPPADAGLARVPMEPPAPVRHIGVLTPLRRTDPLARELLMYLKADGQPSEAGPSPQLR